MNKYSNCQNVFLDLNYLGENLDWISRPSSLAASDIDWIYIYWRSSGMNLNKILIIIMYVFDTTGRFIFISETYKYFYNASHWILLHQIRGVGLGLVDLGCQACNHIHSAPPPFCSSSEFPPITSVTPITTQTPGIQT